MKTAKDIISVASDVDCLCSELRDLQAAMQLFDEAIETDGYQTDENFETWKAVAFAQRFPIHLSNFRVIYRDFVRIVDEIEVLVDSVYASPKAKQKEAAV